jgi:intein/homing endonuclease
LKKVSGEEDRDPEMEEFFFDDIACVIVDECFDGESKVLTTHGYVPIKNIKAGDKVINYCEQTATFKEDTVIKQHRNLTVSSIEKMYEMEFDNGSVIKVTGNHKFLTNLGWCRADELTENHEIVNKS